MNEQRIAVILAAHGEAETAGFVDNFSMIRHTLSHAGEVMRLPLPLQIMISLVGGVKNSVQFRRTGFRSPQNAITRKQAEMLAEKLNRQGGRLRFDVHPSFFVTPPFVDEVFNKTRDYDLQLLVPMAPVDNRLMSGSLQMLAGRSAPLPGRPCAKVIAGFWKDAGLHRVYVDHLFLYGEAVPGSTLVLAFHGTLELDTKGAKPGFHTGAKEMADMAAALRRAVLDDPRNTYGRVEVAYLNHDVGGTWSSPSLQEKLGELCGEGVGSVELFNCGYFSDGTETVVTAREHVAASCLEHAGFIPCVNDSEAFAEYLAAKVAQRVTGET
ncbi:ferrochelatase [Prosthecochloris vibrioformis]|uniref:Ferrochelatase n=1 Tax=Prosthecochloris vibrioformis TaxID=1098 RepID=A0A5C4RZF8_PROVB|nr:ferrochelatase [Prosthecochloris vibrioformis]TNJ36673.1 ferrochelatase [Prosthecochloris vibrioformis]